MITGEISQGTVDESLQDQDMTELVRYKVSEDGQSIKRIALPKVPDDLKIYQTDEALHQRIWQYYASIFPATKPWNISYLIIYTDGGGDSTRARIWELDKTWRLYIDILDFDDQYSTTETLVHEFGHVLTLNHLQVKETEWVFTQNMQEVDYEKTLAGCKTFFSGSTCALANSYLNQFGQRFWHGEVYETWFEVYKTGKDAQEQAESEFYEKYASHFVTQYAATNPHEDMAETWAEFVLRPKPKGATIAEQKILFFYEYPDLVKSRAEIIQGICRYAAGLPAK